MRAAFALSLPEVGLPCGPMWTAFGSLSISGAATFAGMLDLDLAVLLERAAAGSSRSDRADALLGIVARLREEVRSPGS